MMWAVVLVLLVALALAGYLLGGRLFAAASESRTPQEAEPPAGGCCGFNLPPEPNNHAAGPAGHAGRSAETRRVEP